MVKNYGIHDEWKDLNKVNDIDIKSVDGVIDSIKVNGEEAGGGGENSYTIKTIVVDYTTQEPITDPDLYVSAIPAFRIPFMDGDPEPYIFTMYDNGTIDLYYQNYDDGTVMDTITVKAKYPFFLSSVEVLIGDTVKEIDDGTYNNTPVNPTDSFQIEESGTLKLFVL